MTGKDAAITRLLRSVFEAWESGGPDVLHEKGRVLVIWVTNEDMIALADYGVSCPDPDKVQQGGVDA